MTGGENPHTVMAVAKEVKRKASFLMQKSFIQPHDVYRLSKEFFKAFLDKQIEFTSHELHHELHKVYLTPSVRIKVESYIEKLSLMEYSESQLSQDDVKMLLGDLQLIIDDLVREHHETIPWLTRFAHWIFRKKPVVKPSYLSDVPAIENNTLTNVDMNKWLEQLYLALDEGKIKKAHNKYAKIVDKYHQLGSTTQHEFYHKVHTAYQRIVEATKK